MRLFVAIALLLTVSWSCTPKAGSKVAESPASPEVPTQYDEMGKPLVGGEEEPVEEYTIMDGVDIMPEQESEPDTLPPYNPSHTFEHDLIHTKIDIRFDWEKKHALGKATLTLRPWFYSTNSLTLDAQFFDIHSIRFEGQPVELPYDYDQKKLVIQLGKTFTRNEEFRIVIEYTAKPDERPSDGGSTAIAGDKGLYFINADGSDPNKPKQIWTQGETEANSCWFPTVDKPNERCTQEMYITVDNRYVTLSNGVLVSSAKNTDGTRTDYWKMDKPHAPYLFMMAIGEFAVVKDKWRNIELSYYVEPKYEAYAKDIFPYTPEMLEFFSNKLDYAYPWSKYAQVVVRDYVSGAMENTTGVIFGEFLQKTKRELLDDHLGNERIVAHEMFHHWFGDLVTTESWANLTLNEGFANYSEYLWFEHKYGRDAADDHLRSEQEGYLYSMMNGGHPLIHYGYDNRESMFDAHSYNKGGCVLHMLRHYLGDEAFFAALNRYLKTHAYTDVEAHELRMAFEDVSGRDMNWFFNQWYFGSGHPQLNISYDWDAAAKNMIVRIEQQQEGDDVPRIFHIPMAVDIYDASGKARREQILISKRSQEFRFDAPAQPALVNVDADKALLCEKNDNHSTEEWIFMYRHAPLYRDRWEALEALQESTEPGARQVFTEALRDKSDAIRRKALAKADIADGAALKMIADLAQNDPEPGIRATAIEVLGEKADPQYKSIFEKGLQGEQAYSITGASLSALVKIDPAAAVAASKALQNDDSEAVILSLSQMYASHPQPGLLEWFERGSKKLDYMNAFAFFDHYQQYLVKLNDPAVVDQGINNFKIIATNTSNSLFRRFGATKAIADLRNDYKQKGDTEKADALNKLIAEIRDQETDPTLKMYYGMF